ncbi:hypothetical protein HYX58_01475 [Candidatus Dependentiae bacterium]|nr:hypothetical protein [Candidatus Dependentiae bacterium]
MESIFLNLPFLPKDTSWFRLVADAMTVGAALYGIFRVWPTFVRQKRTESLIADAKEASEIISDAEEICSRLVLTVKKAQQNPELIDEEKHMQLQIDALAVFNKLRNALRLLCKNSDIAHNTIVYLTACIEKLEQICKSQYPHFPSLQKVLDVVEKVGLLNKNEFNFKQFEELREVLLQIHDLER